MVAGKKKHRTKVIAMKTYEALGKFHEYLFGILILTMKNGDLTWDI